MLKFLVAFLILIITTLFDAFVLSKMYVWFLVAPFALPVVPWYTFVAVSLAVNLTHPTNVKATLEDAEYTTMLERFMFDMIKPTLTLLSAYLIYLYFI